MPVLARETITTCLLAGGPGLTFGRNEEASTSLLDDLRSDDGMGWVPDEMWLSYLPLSAPAAELDYDLAISTSEDGRFAARAQS